MRKRKIRRGDIYMANIPKGTRGSVQTGIRPVLVIQNDQKNETSPTIVVLAITSRRKRLDLREHVLLPKMEGLPRLSMVMAEQQFTLDKSYLRDYCCSLYARMMKQVDRAVRYVVFGKKSKRKYQKKRK